MSLREAHTPHTDRCPSRRPTRLTQTYVHVPRIILYNVVFVLFWLKLPSKKVEEKVGLPPCNVVNGTDYKKLKKA